VWGMVESGVCEMCVFTCGFGGKGCVSVWFGAYEKGCLRVGVACKKGRW